MAAMARDDRKRKQYNDDADEDGDRRGRRDKRPKEEKPAPPLPSEIRNKEKRNEVYVKVKHEKKAQKRKLGRERVQAAELVEQVPEKQVPRMIENTREPDETVCRHDDQEWWKCCDRTQRKEAGALSQGCTWRVSELDVTCGIQGR